MAVTVTQEIGGRVALARRMSGLCITCGMNKPGIDKKTGFQEYQCVPCQARANEAEKQASKVKA